MFVRQRSVNPLLGVYYGIFTAVFIGLVVFLLILEHMNIINEYIFYALSGAALFLAICISLAVTTNQADDFYVSGRRVPAGLNGLILFVLSVGGAGLSGLTACIFFFGMDGFGLLFGALFGLLLSGLLLSGFVRKAGVYTLPSFFEVRYQSRIVGFLSALVLIFPVLLFALAELSFLKFLTPLVFGVSAEISILFIFFVCLFLLLPGGVRSSGWAQCALAIVVLLGVLIPLIIVSLKLTYLPLAQVTYGSLIDEISNDRWREGAQGAQSAGLASVLKNEFHALTLPFIGGERVFTGLDKILLMLVMAFGIAATPSVLLRSSMTPTVFQARKSFAWGVALLGLMILSIPAVAIFFQYIIFSPESRYVVGDLPQWMSSLGNLGLLKVNDLDSNGLLEPSEIRFARDLVLFGLPVVADLNGTMKSLGCAALMSAAFASLIGRIMTLSNLLSRELHFQKSEMESDVIGHNNLLWTRLMVVLTGFALCWLALFLNISGFALYLCALIFCASSIFPVLILSVWWNRMTKVGFIFGLLSGVLMSSLLIYFTHFGLSSGPLGLSLFHSSALVIGLVFLCSIVGSYVGPKPSGAEQDVLMDIRTPGGEALYDRLLRSAMPRRSSLGD